MRAPNLTIGLIAAVTLVGPCGADAAGQVGTTIRVASPSLTVVSRPNITPYVQVLFGGAHVSGSVKVPGSTATVSVSQNGFDFQPGGGVDIRASKAVGIRLGVNGDFIRSEGETSKEFQFIAGVVIRR